MIRILATLFTVFFASYASASVFTIADIRVSADGKNALQAKEAALLEGEKKALKKLFERITPAFSSHLWPEPEDENISDLVQGFDIKDEEITRTHYNAIVNITFNSVFIEKMLQEAGVSLITKEADPIIVLPLLSYSDELLLWQKNNSWKNAWQDIAEGGGFIPLIIPKGDKRDMENVDIAAISSDIFPLDEKAREGIDALMKRYGAKKLLLAHAYYNAHDARPDIKVDLTYLDEDYPKKESYKFRGKGGAGQIEPVLKYAASQITNQMNKAWKNKIEATLGNESSAEVFFAINNIDQWNNFSNTINSFDFLKKVDIKSIKVNEAMLEIYFTNGYNEMVKKLAENNYYIENSEDKLWIKYYQDPPLWFRREEGLGTYESGEESYEY